MSPRTVNKNRAAVLTAVVGGATRIQEVVEATGLSGPTVRKRLDELETAGRIHVQRQLGRKGSLIELAGGSPATDYAAVGTTTEADSLAHRRLSTALPVAAVWIKTPLANHRRAVSELRASGANAVLDCTGGFNLFAIYPSDKAHAALRMARVLSKREGYEFVDYGLIIGPSEPH